MSTIAKKLNITVGSLTTAMNNLVKKLYVSRTRSEKDRRVVNVALTEKGMEALKWHDRFHLDMTDAALAQMSDEEIADLAKVLERLATFFRTYDKK